jgi:hypothetical protein
VGGMRNVLPMHRKPVTPPKLHAQHSNGKRAFESTANHNNITERTRNAYLSLSPPRPFVSGRKCTLMAPRLAERTSPTPLDSWL